MITCYSERKNEVLAEYDKFMAIKKELEDMLAEAKIPSPFIRCKESLDMVERKAKDIHEDKFRLMIAGEAKAGKSTFINAYLGIEILPMDIKQCTSSIVEIVCGGEFRLVATYAGGRIETVKGEENIRKFLSQKAAINDNYRDIPVATINYDLLVRYGKGNKKIHQEEINNFLNDKTVQAANIYSIENYDKKIRDYITKEQNNWRSIITKINVFYPFENEAFKGIEIVDSPGVCARGGVSEITEKYIENADAIIFLKPVSGQALESRQFSEFLKDKTLERSQNSLFLVLTRSADVTPAELERIKEEAHKQFGKILTKNNIIAVDSKTELYANLFKNCDTSQIAQKIIELNSKGDLPNFVELDWFKSHNNKDDYISCLKTRSNFGQIDTALSAFGRKAHYIMLADFLGKISDLYTRIINDINDNSVRLREKAENPDELDRKINEIKKELAQIEEKMNAGLTNAVSKYTSDGSIICERAEKAAEDFKTQTEKINPDTDNSFDELERQINRKIDEYKELEKELQEKILAEFDELLIEVSDKGDIPYTALQPDFSDEVFKRIIKSTESKAEETRHYEEGVCIKRTHSYSAYSRKKHFNAVKNDIFSRLEEIKSDLVTHLYEFVNNVKTRYLKELASNADLKAKELDAIKAARLTAEQTLALADNMDKIAKDGDEAKKFAKSIKEGIDKYVH